MKSSLQVCVFLIFILVSVLQSVGCANTVDDYILYERLEPPFKHEINLVASNLESRVDRSLEDMMRNVKNLATHIEHRLKAGPAQDMTSSSWEYERYNLVTQLDVLNEIINLQRTETRLDCSIQSMVHFIEVMKVALNVGTIAQFVDAIRANARPVTGFKNIYKLLDFYGKPHLEACIYHAEEAYRAKRLNSNIEAEEELIEVFFGKENNDNSSQALVDQQRILREMDFGDLTAARQEPDYVRNLVKSVEYPEKLNEDSSKKAEFLIDQTARLCKRFRAVSSDIYDMYSLAAAVLPMKAFRPVEKPEFLRANELSRICIQFLDPERREVLSYRFNELMVQKDN